MPDPVMHKRERIVDDESQPGRKIVECSCGDKWSISHLEWSNGDDKFDAHKRSVGLDPRND